MKYSTMAMAVNYVCNNCNINVGTRYHCTVCDDFDLCVSCFHSNGHPHPMVKLDFSLEEDSGTCEQEQTNLEESRRLSIQRCIQSLVHACKCRDANCRLPSCQKMKPVVQHAKSCKRISNGGCPVCKQLIAICCYHAKRCQEYECQVPFCPGIKYKTEEQQWRQGLQQGSNGP